MKTNLAEIDAAIVNCRIRSQAAISRAWNVIAEQDGDRGDVRDSVRYYSDWGKKRRRDRHKKASSASV